MKPHIHRIYGSIWCLSYVNGACLFGSSIADLEHKVRLKEIACG